MGGDDNKNENGELEMVLEDLKSKFRVFQPDRAVEEEEGAVEDLDEVAEDVEVEAGSLWEVTEEMEVEGEDGVMEEEEEEVVSTLEHSKYPSNHHANL